MILLALGIAIPDEHARLTRLETSTPLLTALGAAGVCRHIIRSIVVHML
jgi:hypothetical protein